MNISSTRNLHRNVLLQEVRPLLQKDAIDVVNPLLAVASYSCPEVNWENVHAICDRPVLPESTCNSATCSDGD